MARRRSLRPEEAEIWAAVARTARPMHPGRQLFLKEVEAPAHAVSFHPETTAPHGHAQPRVPFFQLGEKSKPASRIDLTPTPAQALAAAALAACPAPPVYARVDMVGDAAGMVSPVTTVTLQP